MRGRNLATLKSKINLPYIKSDIFEFEIYCQQQIYRSKKVNISNGFVMINTNLPDVYWNYGVIEDCQSLDEAISVLNRFGQKPCIYCMSSASISDISWINLEYQDAWMILANCVFIDDESIRIEVTDNQEKFTEIYKSGRSNTDGNSPYEFASYDELLIKRQFEYAGNYVGDIDIKHFWARIDGVPVGVATTLTKDYITAICDVTVVKEYRRNGIGQALMSTIASMLSNKNTVYLITEKGTHTEKWYKKQGYETILLGHAIKW